MKTIKKTLISVALATLGTIGMPAPAQAIPAAVQIADRSPYCLTDGEWDVVWQIQQQCHEITEGLRTSTAVEIDAAKVLGKDDWTADDFGIEPMVRDGNENVISDDFHSHVKGLLNVAVERLMETIHLGAPSTVEWADRYEASWAEFQWNTAYRDGRWHMSIAQAHLYIPVAPDYKPRDDAYYEVDQGRMQAIRDSLDRAQEIANRHAGEPASQRLRSYVREIGNLSSLGRVNSDNTYTSLLQWGFTSVFDGDSGTPTVCEGFSKALALLVELSGRDDLTVYSVFGEHNTFAGDVDHMWNIAKMSDGRKYLVDVGNSMPGTVGSKGGLVFATTDGNMEDGYDTNGGGVRAHYSYSLYLQSIFTYDALVLTCGGFVEPYVAPAPEEEEAEGTTYEPSTQTGEESAAPRTESEEERGEDEEEEPEPAPEEVTEEKHDPTPLVLTSKTYPITLSEEDIEKVDMPKPDHSLLVRTIVAMVPVALAPVAATSVVNAKRRNARVMADYIRRTSEA